MARLINKDRGAMARGLLAPLATALVLLPFRADWSNTNVALVLVAVIALAGGFALATLVQQQFPNIDFPTVQIRLAYAGAPPTEIRDAIVRPVEDAIAGAPDLGQGSLAQTCRLAPQNQQFDQALLAGRAKGLCHSPVSTENEGRQVQ